MKTINILWTGGWDSTFRLIELSLQTIVVQPIYCLDKNRKSYQNEIDAMNEILFELRNKPQTKARIKDIKYVDISSIPENQDISMAFDRISKSVRIGIQYDWLSRLSTIYPMLELGIEKPSGEYSGIVTAIKYAGDFTYNGDTYVVDKTISSDDINLVFGNMSFPIVNKTETEMLQYIKSIEYEDVMSKIWFCHDPIEGQPCGICRPCQQKMECGMEWLLSKKAQKRYRVNKSLHKIFGNRIGSRVTSILYRK